MRSITLAFLMSVCVISAGFAQIKVSGKGIIKTPTVLCDKCKDRVEFFISHEVGVTSVKVDLKRKTTTVTWLNDRTTLENIKVAIANLGFDADDIEAEESAFKRLPKECRKQIETSKAPPVKN